MGCPNPTIARVKLRDTATGQEVLTLQGHTGAFSGDAVAASTILDLADKDMSQGENP